MRREVERNEELLEPKHVLDELERVKEPGKLEFARQQLETIADEAATGMSQSENCRKKAQNLLGRIRGA